MRRAGECSLASELLVEEDLAALPQLRRERLQEMMDIVSELHPEAAAPGALGGKVLGLA